jgi:hypothetical protein
MEMGILRVVLAFTHGQDKLVGLHALRSEATGPWAGRPARPKPGDLRGIARDSVCWGLIVSCGA